MRAGCPAADHRRTQSFARGLTQPYAPSRLRPLQVTEWRAETCGIVLEKGSVFKGGRGCQGQANPFAAFAFERALIIGVGPPFFLMRDGVPSLSMARSGGPRDELFDAVDVHGAVCISRTVVTTTRMAHGPFFL